MRARERLARTPGSKGHRWAGLRGLGAAGLLLAAPACATGLTSADGESDGDVPEGTGGAAGGVAGPGATTTGTSSSGGAGSNTTGASTGADGGATVGSSGVGGGAGVGGGPSAASSGAGGSPVVACDISGCDVDDPNPATRCSGGSVVAPIVAPAGTQWAAAVMAVSSEYTSSSWGALQALGAPNTYPQHGDITTAWAPSTPDSAAETITLEFVPPAAGSQVWIYETYNPDAIQTVTITTAMGDAIVYQAAGSSVGGCAYVLSAATGTDEPVTHVKIDLAAQVVAGYNELDAVGIVP